MGDIHNVPVYKAVESLKKETVFPFHDARQAGYNEGIEKGIRALKAIDSQVISMSTLEAIIYNAENTVLGAEDICSCAACALSSDCPRRPLGSQSYCTARKFRHLVLHKAKKAVKGDGTN